MEHVVSAARLSKGVRDAGIWLQIQPSCLQSSDFCSAGAKGQARRRGAKPEQMASRNHPRRWATRGQLQG